MGVEYDILDHANRRVFDLSKGPWWFLKEDCLEPTSLSIEVAAGLTQAEYGERFYRVMNEFTLEAWSRPVDAEHERDLGERVWAFFERSRWEAEVQVEQLSIDYEPAVYEVVDAAYPEWRVWCPYEWGTFPWSEAL